MTLTADLSIHGGAYEFPKIRKLGPRKARLLEDYVFYVGITGHTGAISIPISKRCELTDNGFLICRKGFEWDYGTFAIDTPNMIVASMFHDAICYMTNGRQLPWSVREKGDKAFRQLLKAAKAREESWRSPMKYISICRRWCAWAGVRFNSNTRAKWRSRK